MRRKLNTKSICTRKPSNMSAKPDFASRRKSAVKRKFLSRFKCSDGALAGHTLYLSCAGTMPFTLNGVKGFYNNVMEWVQL